MATIRPFRGWRYDPAQAGALSDVTCPPYDVISAEEQRGFYQRSPYNIIRVEYGEMRPTDTPTDNRYTRARAELERWKAVGALRQEAVPALYLYEQQFQARGELVRRQAWLVDLKVEPWSSGVVLPHEETMSGPKADRLEVLRTVQANTSPIFGLYPDPDRLIGAIADEVAASTPDADLTDEAGEQHRLWAVRDPATLERLVRAFAGQPILIADGHHRYETALGYSTRADATTGADGILIALVAEDDPGLRIYPTHRTVQDADTALLDQLPSRVADQFDIRPIGPLTTLRFEDVEAALAASSQPAFALAGLPAGEVSILSPRGDWRAKLPPKSTAWQDLDLVALHALLLEPLLGIDVDQEGEGRVRFTRDAEGALAGVRDGSLQLAAFLSPPQARAIREVAQAGDRMPHKSTYFYPKMRTGLVIRGIGPNA
ncbi:MAG: DUF1015 domain-containing protein [Dehalococcoidia bacterium]